MGCVVEELRLAWLDRIIRRDNRRQRIVRDLDALSGVPRLLERLSNHNCNRVANVTHLAHGEHRVRRFDHRRAVLRIYQPAAGQAADLQVGAGEDRIDARCRAGLAGVDAGDLGMGVRTSQNIGVALAWTIDIVGVVTRAGEETKVLLAPHRGADDLFVHRLPPPGQYTLERLAIIHTTNIAPPLTKLAPRL